jgi:hypothetical protein
MPYEVILDQETGLVDRLTTLPVPIQETIFRELRRLAQAPTRLSSRATVPQPPGYQVYRFEHRGEEGIAITFAAYFQYGSDEGTLWVYDVRQET